ncbi:TetR/AcrR family transcriptional regulator [Bradymonas sediminis]|nr:TetR/AcrR family transcriptional regulator [Bradymonas sediminis]TDP75356.1 TetR family transcriptional regulator [Bradymonas sediminis]
MTKHRSPDERATQILDAARVCFMQRGYFATRMEQIAKESGLSKGGIYFHFGSKRDIFRSLVEREYQKDMDFIDSVLDVEKDILSILSGIGEHFMQAFASTDTPRFTAIIVEMAIRDEEIREMLEELQNNYITRMADVLERAMDEGQLRKVDPIATATLLKAIIDGVQASMAVGGDPPDLEGLLGVALQLLTQGLLTEDALA